MRAGDDQSDVVLSAVGGHAEAAQEGVGQLIRAQARVPGEGVGEAPHTGVDVLAAAFDEPVGAGRVAKVDEWL